MWNERYAEAFASYGTEPNDFLKEVADQLPDGPVLCLAEGDVVTNHLYLRDGDPHAFQWPRLPQRYHGSGCTLSSACALYLATGDDPVTAVDRAQSFTATALRAATKPGGGQWLPWRRG